MGVEAVGSDGPDIDAEVIQLATKIYKELELDVTLAVNSIGHPGCRADYIPKLQDIPSLGVRPAMRGLRSEKSRPTRCRTFDCKVENDRKLLENAPLIVAPAVSRSARSTTQG